MNYDKTPEYPIDLVFPVAGDKIEVAHGYPLYAAIVGLCPELHEIDHVGVHSIRGGYAGGGMLKIRNDSKLAIRMHQSNINIFMRLTMKNLQIGGWKILIGIPEVNYLMPAATLYSPFVTIMGAALYEDWFNQSVKKQMNRIGVQGDVTIGTRKTIPIRNQQMIGYSLAIKNLTPRDSLELQTYGLGGKRKMGCGLFHPEPEERISKWIREPHNTYSSANDAAAVVPPIL